MSFLPSSPETDLAAAPAASVLADTVSFPVLNTSGNLARGTLSGVLAYIQGHFADLSAVTLPVVLTGTTILDASVHQRRLLVASTSLTINLPATIGNLGQSFDATVVAAGASVVTWGTGFTSLSSTLTAGQSARVVTYNAGAGPVVQVLVNTTGGTAPTPTVTIANVPTAGWIVGTAKALTGATATLANITTAYAVLWSGTAEVGARQAFTSSATLAALSVTPATANATHTLRVYDAASAGNVLAETAVFTVVAAAAGGMAVASSTANVVFGNGLYKLVGQPNGPFGVAGNPGSVPTGGPYVGCIIVRANPTGVDKGNDYGSTYNGQTFPAGSNTSDGTVDATHGGFASVQFGLNYTAAGTAATAKYPLAAPFKNLSGSLIGVLPGAFNWALQINSPPDPTGTTFYFIVTTSDGYSVAIGPLTKA